VSADADSRVVVRAGDEVDVLAELDSATAAGASVFVLVSSARIYGADPRHDMLMTEEQPLAGRFDDTSLEAVAEADRICCDQARGAVGAAPGMRIVVLRPVHLLGPGADGPLARYLAADRVRGRFGFDPFVQVMHTDDLARAIDCAVEAEISGPYNVVGAGGLPLSKLVGVAGASRITGPTGVLVDLVAGLGIDLTARMDDRDLRYVLSVDGSSFARDSGYEPVCSLAETVAAASHEVTA